MRDNIVFTLKQIENLKNTTNPQTKEIIKSALTLADDLLSGKEDWRKFISGGRGQVTEVYGFAHYFTGDEKYFIEAKKVMDEICAIEDWFPRGAHGGSFKGRSDLISCRRAANISYGYEIFKDRFTEEEKAYYVKNNLEKGIKLVFEDWVLHDTRIHALDTMGHNFWVYLIANGGISALMMADAMPEIAEYANLAAKSLEAWFNYEGNHINCKPKNIDNGGYWEGIDYYNHSIYMYIIFAGLYRNRFNKKPFDDEAILKEVAEYIIDFHYPSSFGDIKPDFGDSTYTKKQSAIVALIQYGIDDPEYVWFLKRGFEVYTDSVMQMLAWDEISKKEAKMPTKLSHICPELGWAEFRDSFEENKTMLAIKCGDTFNHSHADAGTFILFRNGVAEIEDSGEAINYSSPAYQGYYVQSRAHNVVLFEEKGQDYRDNYKDHVHVKGRIPYFKDEDGFRYALADISGPMGRWFRKHHRHFLWIDNCILIYDDIECYDNGVCNFLIHERSEETCFKMLTPCEYTLKDGHRETSTEPNCKYKSYNLNTDSDGHAKFVSMLCLDDNIKPTYEEYETYIKVTYGETVFYINKTSK